jgi:hypothetical protein
MWRVLAEADPCKHKSSSRAGRFLAAPSGQPQPRDRRTSAWLLSPADGNAEPARAAEGKVAEAQARIRTRRMLKAVAGARDRWRVLLSERGHAARIVSACRDVCFAPEAEASPARRKGRDSSAFSWIQQRGGLRLRLLHRADR